MLTLIILAILLTLNMLLAHGNIIVKGYYWLYRKCIKPKFMVGELVFINGVEFEIALITKSYRPYTYFCIPIKSNNISRMLETYYHESDIKKKTGLLKELE